MSEGILQNYLNKKRLLLVFCRDPEDKTCKWQKNELHAYQESLDQRNIEVIYFSTDGSCQGADLDNNEVKLLFKKYEIKKGAFTAVLIDLDGKEKLRDNRPLSAQALLSIIDVMPTRKQEKDQ